METGRQGQTLTTRDAGRTVVLHGWMTTFSLVVNSAATDSVSTLSTSRSIIWRRRLHCSLLCASAPRRSQCDRKFDASSEPQPHFSGHTQHGVAPSDDNLHLVPNPTDSTHAHTHTHTHTHCPCVLAAQGSTPAQPPKRPLALSHTSRWRRAYLCDQRLQLSHVESPLVCRHKLVPGRHGGKLTAAPLSLPSDIL